MKRLSHLITPEKITIEFCKECIYDAAQHKTKRRTVSRILDRIDDYAMVLRTLLLNVSYQPSSYIICKIKDKPSGKERILHKPKFFPDQCIHHAMIKLIKEKLMSYFDKNCLSGIPGRGIQKGHKILSDWIHGYRNETRYCLKCDIRKFYEHVEPEVVMRIMRKIVKDPLYLKLTEKIIYSNTSLPLGNYTSGWYANLILTELDRFILSKTKYYLRYADDFVVFSDNKKFLHNILVDIKDILSELKLSLKPNYQIFPVKIRGVDMLGYRYFPCYTLRRKRNSLRMMRSIRRFKKHQTEHNSISAKSMIGQCKWFNSYHFLKKYNLI